MRPEDLIASTLKHDPGYDSTLAKLYKAACLVAEENDAEFPLTMTEYGHLLYDAGYSLYLDPDGRTKLRDTGIQYHVHRRYFRR
ncbi:hypothetical protein [Streptomyces sp. NBC_01718]|uniref:hypothetical protein n=1 Tax=Streptomyces sp. NBC_01718 TaxID=2975919 RepID=UPI00352DE867